MAILEFFTGCIATTIEGFIGLVVIIVIYKVLSSLTRNEYSNPLSSAKRR